MQNIRLSSLDFDLGREIDMLRTTVRGFAEDRIGTLMPGMRADVNIIDFDRLQLHKPELVHDMPAGGRRFVQRVEGYEATLAAGIPIFERGEHTGALPGRLVRAGHNGHR